MIQLQICLQTSAAEANICIWQRKFRFAIFTRPMPNQSLLGVKFPHCEEKKAYTSSFIEFCPGLVIKRSRQNARNPRAF
jgi:hypothetical protein